MYETEDPEANMRSCSEEKQWFTNISTIVAAAQLATTEGFKERQWINKVHQPLIDRIIDRYFPDKLEYFDMYCLSALS